MVLYSSGIEAYASGGMVTRTWTMAVSPGAMSTVADCPSGVMTGFATPVIVIISAHPWELLRLKVTVSV